MKKFLTSFCAAAAMICGLSQSQAALITESASPNVAIPDNSPNLGASSDIFISSSDSQLAGLMNPAVLNVASVTFTITGGFDGDYSLLLQHIDTGGATSESYLLFNSLLGGAAANSGFNSVTLSSTGSGSLSDAVSTTSTAPVTGTYGVDFGTTFQGATVTGDWVLYATDNQAGDSGTLTSWSLSLEPVPEPVNVALGIFGGLMAVIFLSRSKGARRLWEKRNLAN